MEHVHVQQHSSAGIVWLVGWLFTIGYLHLDLLRGLYAIVIWPYYIGRAFAGF